ncbi:dihydrofolate reductase family protein [Chitinophaga sp. RCC_12]|uniref:dihydrofolate reductase family protein n=1 Tax=unclassified Chitinophaga TaxID=2619133 RepID=UPI003525626B
MRKLIVSSFVSLDGVVDKPWEWVGSFFDQEHKQDSLTKLKDVDLFLLSRPTYEHFASLWPNIKGEAYFDHMNALPKLVASKTIKEAGWNATVINGEVTEEIARLKQGPGKHILKYGFGDLDRTLMLHHLIDELQLCIIPVAVGKGRRIFEGMDPDQVKLTLTDIRNFENGAAILTYVPSGSKKQ